AIPYTVEVKTVDQYGKAIYDADATVTAIPRATGTQFTADVVPGKGYDENANGKVEYVIEGDDNGSNTIRFEVQFDGKKYAKTLNVSQANQNGLGGYIPVYDAVLDKNAGNQHSADDSVATTTVQ